MKKISVFISVLICFALILVRITTYASAEDTKVKGEMRSSGKALESKTLTAEGRYLVRIAGCNDCHTDGWMTTAGRVPEKDWLKGSTTGWTGPWGTTYPPNLRIIFKGLSEQSWLAMAHVMKARPPMPWYELQLMRDRDLKAIFHFIKGLGTAGENAPLFMPPGIEPKPPFFRFVPPS